MAPATPAQPAPQRLAAVAPAAPVVPASAVTAPPADGGYAVQLDVQPSEAGARTAFQKLQQKHTDLNGRAPMIRKAEVNGNTIYRVRVGPLSKDDATSLCSKLQGAGGQCFVAKN